MSDGWEGILDPGEEILWQGRPDGGFHLRGRDIFTLLFGLFFAGFALVWMIAAAAAGGGFWAFGLIHFTVGLVVMGGPTLWSMILRRNTWYTLTDRRAIIATDAPLAGRRLKSYPIVAQTQVEFIDARHDSIHFAETIKRGKNGTYRVPIGFEYIEEGPRVLGLIRGIQQAHAAGKVSHDG